MALGPRLDLRQSQQLVMTPQLQQAIKLLTLTNLELESYLAGEIEKNPLLEASNDDGSNNSSGSDDAGERGDDRGSESGEPSSELTASDSLLGTDVRGQGGNESDSPLDVDYTTETFHHDSAADSISSSDGAGLDGSLSLSGTGAGSGAMPEDGSFDAQLSAPRSLADVLEEQASAALSGPELLLARHLIDLIDEAGYFTGVVAEIAERLDIALAMVERVLRVIQTFEPSGVGARNLSECLKIQAAEADRLDPAMERMLDNLDLVARGDMAGLRRVCRVEQEDIADMIRELRTYNPKPGLIYGETRAQMVVPDIFVAMTASGGWAVELNSATLPRVLINRSYYVELTGAASDKESRAWLNECLASASWLAKTLDQRARTITKVATEIVRQQDGFFRFGVAHLKPLTLRMVADAIGMHESTVSRVTTNKFLSCSRGLFELTYFFTSAIQSSEGGEAVSAESVRARIGDLIATETADAILSDDKLVDLLRGEGFDIARRTVAKYREAMGLGSSVQRRRAALLRAANVA